MTRCHAHGNRIQLNPSRAVNLFGATLQPYCRRIDSHDRRKGAPRMVSHRLSEEERQRILLTCTQPQYAAQPPGQIVPAPADQGLYIGS